MKELNTANSVEEYIEGFPKEVQSRLNAVRKILKGAAPDAKESISYRMPYYELNGRLLYYAGFENHVGFYPLTSAMKAFKKELASYKQGKGSVQFPHDKPLPLTLIKKIVTFRVKENRGKKKT